MSSRCPSRSESTDPRPGSARLDKDGFIHRSWVGRGLPEGIFDGRPIIGICNTWSELTPCNLHFRELAEHVKRGVWEAGGIPFEFPVMSLGETSLRPTAMLFRNLASMDVEESIRGNPIDGVVLLCGCDKTTPALRHGRGELRPAGDRRLRRPDAERQVSAASRSARAPTSGASARRSRPAQMSARRSSCRPSPACRARPGTCNVMGTASTMASMVEALGLTLPDNAAIPAVDSRRYAQAHLAGRRIVELVERGRPHLADPDARGVRERDPRERRRRRLDQRRASTCSRSPGASASRSRSQDWDDLGRDVPTLVDLMPSGRFLMEDFYYAGGLPAVIRTLGEHGLLNRDALTVNGQTHLGELQGRAELQRRSDPPVRQAARGAAAASPCCAATSRRPARCSSRRRRRRSLMQHRGRAVVFENIEHYNARIKRSGARRRRDLRAGAQELRTEGLSGHGRSRQHGPAAEGPRRQGVTDMVRISDARMSGTAYGTAVLHVSPEAAAGGPLALVRDGDMIELDVARPAAAPRRQRRRARGAPRGMEAAAAGPAARRLRAAVHRARAAGGPGRRSRISSSAAAATRWDGNRTRSASASSSQLEAAGKLRRRAGGAERGMGPRERRRWELAGRSLPVKHETASLRPCRTGKARPPGFEQPDSRSVRRRPRYRQARRCCPDVARSASQARSGDAAGRQRHAANRSLRRPGRQVHLRRPELLRSRRRIRAWRCRPSRSSS